MPFADEFWYLEKQTETEGMTSPVRCLRCSRGVYDLGTVKVVTRYADCSTWKTPCCNALVDDRGNNGWAGRKEYEHLKVNPRRRASDD